MSDTHESKKSKSDLLYLRFIFVSQFLHHIYGMGFGTNKIKSEKFF